MNWFKNKNIKTIIKNVLLVVIGTLILALGTAIFIIPTNLVVGGISGIALDIMQLLPEGAMPIDLLITIITWTTFLLGLIFLGKEFAAKTLISAIVYPIGISLFLRLASPNVFHGFFLLTNSAYEELAYIVSSLVGGALIGVGCAITFIGGGSTGGVDIIAFIVCKYIKKLKVSVVIFCLDALVIALGVFTSKDLVISLLGILSSLVSNVLVDKVFLGGKQALEAQIITTKSEEFTQAVVEKLDRTTTVISVKGGFTHEEKKMVVVIFAVNQYADFMKLLNTIDSKAFVVVHKAREIYGQDWEPLKMNDGQKREAQESES